MNTIKHIGIGAISFVAGWYLSSVEWPKSEPVISDEVLAVVNGQKIHVNQFIQMMESRGGYLAGQFQSLEQKKKLLDYMVNQELLFGAAKAANLQNNEVVKDLHRKTMVDLYLEQTLKPKIDKLSVSQKEMDQYVEQTQGSMTKPERRRGAIIFKQRIIDNDAANQANKEKLMAVPQDLKDLGVTDNHFGVLAKTLSDDKTSSYQGGVIGWLISHAKREYKWPKAVTDHLFQLTEVGEMSPVIETEKGFYLVRLVDMEAEKKVAMKNASKGYKNRLLSKKRNQLKQEFINQLMAQSNVQVNEPLLDQMAALTELKKTNKNNPPALPSLSGE